jgi:uncharacterized protein YjbI with pentapeptide repeats
VANKEHVEILERGTKAWNDWREVTYGRIEPDLSGINLDGADLPNINFRFTNLSGASLKRARLADGLMARANFDLADLSGANMANGELSQASFRKASAVGASFYLGMLFYADFSGADLACANLRDTFLKGARFNSTALNGTAFDAAGFEGTDFTDSTLIFTSFGHVDLSTSKGLDMVHHQGPSFIGIDTLFMSHGMIPEAFLRGCGVPESFIVQIPALITSVGPIQFYSCFISFAEPDDEFSEKLYRDLRREGVTCWRWKEDAKWGKDLMSSVDEAIRINDKLIVICSEQSLNSPAVIREIERALQKEDELARQGKARDVLFPVRLDDYVLTKWNHHRKADVIAKHIGDFRQWRNPDSYRKAVGRLIADLKA